jgi:hypothetical protein
MLTKKVNGPYRLSWNQGASTSWNPQGLSRPVMGLLFLMYGIQSVRVIHNHAGFSVYRALMLKASRRFDSFNYLLTELHPGKPLKALFLKHRNVLTRFTVTPAYSHLTQTCKLVEKVTRMCHYTDRNKWIKTDNAFRRFHWKFSDTVTWA